VLRPVSTQRDRALASRLCCGPSCVCWEGGETACVAARVHTVQLLGRRTHSASLLTIDAARLLRPACCGPLVAAPLLRPPCCGPHPARLQRSSDGAPPRSAQRPGPPVCALKGAGFEPPAPPPPPPPPTPLARPARYLLSRGPTRPPLVPISCSNQSLPSPARPWPHPPLAAAGPRPSWPCWRRRRRWRRRRPPARSGPRGSRRPHRRPRLPRRSCKCTSHRKWATARRFVNGLQRAAS
jgi:hypothetical protein